MLLYQFDAISTHSHSDSDNYFFSFFTSINSSIFATNSFQLRIFFIFLVFGSESESVRINFLISNASAERNTKLVSWFILPGRITGCCLDHSGHTHEQCREGKGKCQIFQIPLFLNGQTRNHIH